MRKIELPSEALAEELRDHLQDKRFTVANYDKAHRTLQFPDNMNSSQWSSLRSTVEKWTGGRNLEVVESLKLQYSRQDARQEKSSQGPSLKELKAEATKKTENLTPDKAEERYRYLQSIPISELSEAEIVERLQLAGRPSEKSKNPK
ncbi:MAG: hypothetical protein OK441_02940 [Thaumarchaeota archaeon]|nr:hypothetical protein [Nitrososphaerota archaeon]